MLWQQAKNTQRDPQHEDDMPSLPFMIRCISVRGHPTADACPGQGRMARELPKPFHMVPAALIAMVGRCDHD